MKDFCYKKAYTHAGKFHADDVFSSALLFVLNNNIEIIRTNDVSNIEDGSLVFDIGGGKYDHHQPDAEYRENGKKYAAFGLLWREFGDIVCDGNDMLKDRIDEKYIQALDESDNFGYHNEYSAIIDAFNLTWIENELYEKGDQVETVTNLNFFEAVLMAVKILERIIAKETSILVGMDYVKNQFLNSDGKIVVLERSLPWKETLIPTTAEFVVYPSSRGEWNSQVVPVELNSVVAKKDFPYSWAGLRGEELEKESGINDIVFCHSSVFLCASKTKEAAIAACKKALSM